MSWGLYTGGRDTNLDCVFVGTQNGVVSTEEKIMLSRRTLHERIGGKENNKRERKLNESLVKLQSPSLRLVRNGCSAKERAASNPELGKTRGDLLGPSRGT